MIPPGETISLRMIKSASAVASTDNGPACAGMTALEPHHSFLTVTPAKAGVQLLA